jgi:RNA polymerase sigma factor (sigma-70 family)
MDDTLAAGALPRRNETIMDSASRHDFEKALAALYDQHAAGIYRFCLGMLGRREDAEDAIQSLWLKLAGSPAATLGAADPKAFLWAVARNLVRSRLRRRALEFFWTPALGEPPAELLAAGAESDGTDAESRRDLARAVARLRPRLRGVLLLVGIEGHTLEEAAERLDIPRGTAASRYHAAMEKLRQLLCAR